MLRNIFLRTDIKNLRHGSLDVIMMHVFSKFDDENVKNDFDMPI